MLSAGEASGDLHASMLIRAMRSEDPEARFCFLGGDLMAAEAGTKPLIHYRDMAYMGFGDVVRHLPQVRRNFNAAVKLLDRVRPTALILVDYPSFNLRLAREAHKRGIPVDYYISPKVWAWKEWRVKEIKSVCRQVLSILPFEPDFYRRHGYDRCHYVGNPSVEEIDTRLREMGGVERQRKIALVPGSRLSEIRSNLPVMLEAVRPLADKYRIVVSQAPAIGREEYPSDVELTDDTVALMASADAALVTSGTASLEAALCGVPQVVCYRHSGSRLMYGLMERVLKIKYVTLPNLIADREVVPELLLHKCTAGNVLRVLLPLLPGREGRERQLEGYGEVRCRLGKGNAAQTAARLILEKNV